MKGLGVGSLVAILLSAGVLGVHLWAEGEGGGAPSATPAPQPSIAAPAYCGAMMGPSKMQATGQPLCPMGMRGPMTGGTSPSLTDPIAILALRRELGLSEEQVSKLQGIIERARSEAQTLLTEEQRKKLAEPTTGATPVMQMCPRMQMMVQMPMGGSCYPPMMMCPMMRGWTAPQGTPQMCPMMRGGMVPQSTPPKSEPAE